MRPISPRRLISNLLFVAAAVLLGYVAYAYIQDRRDSGETVPTPQSVPGSAELKNVRDALTAHDLRVDYGRDTVRMEGLTPVGQQLLVDDQSVFVFIFESPDERADQTEALDTSNIVLTTPSGSPAGTGPYTLIGGSNVLLVTEELEESLESTLVSGIESIP